jgi:hypothetical membrane protein
MTRLGAILWIACVQFFLAEQVVRRAWTIPYSFATNYVSDLGATGCSALVCSPWHTLMNASFVLQGILIAGGAVLTWKRWNLLGRVGMALLVVCGLGVLVVGFVPEDGNAGLHRLGAALHFLGGGLGLITVGFTLRRSGFGLISMAIGLAVVWVTLVLGQGDSVWVRQFGVGAVERVAAYGIAGWMAMAGGWLWRGQAVR